MTYPASGNKTNFLSRNGLAGDGRGFSDMLMVTSSVRMVDGVHSNTTSTRPATKHVQSDDHIKKRKEIALVTLGPEFVECSTSFEQRFIDPSTSGNNTDRRPRIPGDGLLRSTRQPNPRLIIVWRMSNDSRVIAGSPRQRSSISDLLLDIADDRTFGKAAHRQHVADGKRRLLAAIHKGTSVQTLGRDECFLAKFVPVRVTEDDTSKRRASTRVMNDILDDATNVTISFRKVQRSQAGRVLIEMGVGFELDAR